MTFLITGHKGFIGSNIYKHLQSKVNYKVDGFSRNDKLPNKNYDIIIHCAGMTPSKAKCDFDYIEDNIILTKNIIDKYPNSRIIFLSSRDIYGTPNAEVITEDTIPYKQSFYGMSKYMSENLILKTNDYVILRLPAVLGINSPSTFITRTFNDIINNNKITLFNSDKKFNSIISIGELMLIIDAGITNKKLKNNIYNISSDEYIHIKDIVTIISKQLNKQLPMVEYKNIDNSNSLMSVDKIKKYIKLPHTKDLILKYVEEMKCL